MFFSAVGWVTPVALTFLRSASVNNWVAATPASAISKAPSRSSYKASSIWLPPNTPEMLLAVLPRPALSLSSHFWRSGGVAGASGISIGATSALPISEPEPQPVLRQPLRAKDLNLAAQFAGAESFPLKDDQ